MRVSSKTLKKGSAKSPGMPNTSVAPCCFRAWRRASASVMAWCLDRAIASAPELRRERIGAAREDADVRSDGDEERPGIDVAACERLVRGKDAWRLARAAD